jgi:hypothetical protein
MVGETESCVGQGSTPLLSSDKGQAKDRRYQTAT